ncbi:hypothetical protein, partial [Pseudomonas aeruginosa]|uniref:hypothetical protein n=1 Tax=Pseudomonas aeruginosa TaxID=287 RepID=UPI002811D562
GFGLDSMRQRARCLGAELSLRSRPGQGRVAPEPAMGKAASGRGTSAPAGALAERPRVGAIRGG